MDKRWAALNNDASIDEIVDTLNVILGENKLELHESDYARLIAEVRMRPLNTP